MILHVLITMVAGWLRRHQQQVISYLLEGNRVLKAQRGGSRLRLTDTERRRTHYHRKRNHQGLDNRLIAPEREVGCQTGHVARRERLDGLLRYYHREAA